MSEKEQKGNENLVVMQPPQPNNTITLLEAFGILWQSKFTLVLFVLVGIFFGWLVGAWQRPVYTSDALLQVDSMSNSRKMNRAMGEVWALVDMASPADAEIELIKSRTVLSAVVEKEHLRFSAVPVGAVERLLHKEGRMDLDSLYVPKAAREGAWHATVLNENEFEVSDFEGRAVLKCAVKDICTKEYAGEVFAIRANLMMAEPGQKFALGQVSVLKATRALGRALSVAEKGKQTGVISVKYGHRYPDRAAAVVNAVSNTYLRQNIEMRSAEAEKTLSFLEEQLPQVKAKLDSAEGVFANYRHSIGSVDMVGETKVHLEKEVEFQSQIMALEQQRQAALRLFKPSHPNVITIEKQLYNLKQQLAQLKKKAESMPITQQEVLRLQEEVAVNNAVYTSMLNKIQQLRVVRAGEVGNVRIVDFGQIEAKPSKPRRFNILICAVAAFFMLGVLFVFVRRMLRNGVRSTIEIEKETDISVLAKIPQSKSRRLKGHSHLHHGVPYVLEKSEDLVSEAFRSLLTAVNFMLPKDEPTVMMVTGLVPGVGKSFVSLNLASLMASNGKKVLIIDADMRRGVLHGDAEFGLADVLIGRATLETAVSERNEKNLFVMGSGKAKIMASELLRSDALKNLLNEARKKFDIVLIDTPPLSLVTDAELISPCVDYTLMVLHYARHSMAEIKETVEKLKRYAENVPMSFVMNHCEREPGHYYGFGYSYYGKYGYNRKKKD